MYHLDMERHRIKRAIVASLLAAPALALVGCSVEVDSYHTDSSDVRCDDGRTKSELRGDGLATFVVHGSGNEDPAVITVRRENDLVSVKVEGNVTGPVQELAMDGFTEPTPLVDGAELGTFGSGAAWVVDARPDSVTIEGTCEGS